MPIFPDFLETPHEMRTRTAAGVLISYGSLIWTAYKREWEPEVA